MPQLAGQMGSTTPYDDASSVEFLWARRQRQRWLELEITPLTMRPDDGDDLTTVQGNEDDSRTQVHRWLERNVQEGTQERTQGVQPCMRQKNHADGDQAWPRYRRPPLEQDRPSLDRMWYDTEQMTKQVAQRGHTGPVFMGTLSFRFLKNYRKKYWPAGRFLFLPCANSAAGGQPLPEHQQRHMVPHSNQHVVDTENIRYSVHFTGDFSHVHRVFCEFIDRRLNGLPSSMARHLRFLPGEARNLTLTHMGIADEPPRRNERQLKPRVWCYDPTQGTGLIESIREVTVPLRMVASEQQVVNGCAKGYKEPDVLILDQSRPRVPLMAIEIVYKNESVHGIIHSLSIWTQQSLSAYMPSPGQTAGTRIAPCHALALHVADTPEFRLDTRYPAFAWAEAYRSSPAADRDPTRGGYHGMVLVMNASPGYCALWKRILAEDGCPLRLLFGGNSDIFELPIPLRAPEVDGQASRYVHLRWSLASLTLLYREGRELDWRKEVEETCMSVQKGPCAPSMPMHMARFG